MGGKALHWFNKVYLEPVSCWRLKQPGVIGGARGDAKFQLSQQGYDINAHTRSNNLYSNK
ncbi:hypothetical protein GCM10009720_04100 [Yaniella flava]|uniref:Uncharacterized protein n=1 Tax=Yaniella flava TaxID=287930 RepID=A0ABP5FIS8_9MICC